MKYNIYYNYGGAGAVIRNKSLERVHFWIDAILAVGGEVTGIIDVGRDS